MSIVLPSGILHPDVSGIPEPASTDDGNRWTWGACWGWCERERARVLWLGPAQTTGHVVADLYYCGPCINRLHQRIVARARGAVPDQAPAPERMPRRNSPRHRAPRRLFR
ncbi:hypothetical protein AB0903_29915 [Streptomyces sp. NPDC048389]|uniref:hypothetical protein n=1 Tax=Streptomyces sp. NPDC048389 TaxID=3154622 RepID=UPI003456EA94